MSFPALPYELRAAIYAYAAVPFVSLFDYRGLYLSCKQVRSECNHECALALRSLLRSLRDSTPDICAEIPEADAFSGTCSLRLHLSTATFTDYHLHVQRPPDASIFALLASTYFDSLTIVFHEDSGIPFDIDNIQWINQHIIHGLLRQRDGIHAGRVSVQVPLSAVIHLEGWIALFMIANPRQLKETVHWREPGGAPVGKHERCEAPVRATQFENCVLALESPRRRFGRARYLRTWRNGVVYVFVGSVLFALALLGVLFLHRKA
jgi:hypothetical protein